MTYISNNRSIELNPLVLNFQRTSTDKRTYRPARRAIDMQYFEERDFIYVVDEAEVLRLAKFLKGSKQVASLIGSISAVSDTTSEVLAGNDYKVNFQVSLTEQYLTHFALLRGLLTLGGPRNAGISFNQQNKSFSLQFSPDQAVELRLFLEKIFGWLEKEIQFKAVLSETILFDKRAKEQSQLYAERLRAAAN